VLGCRCQNGCPYHQDGLTGKYTGILNVDGSCSPPFLPMRQSPDHGTFAVI
jgi:hypothetical protein